MLDKTYQPSEVEPRHDRLWEEQGQFKAHPDADRAPYCIMMPPPNVTGSLHLGHALDSTIQDTLVRFHRMLGKSVLWQPGSDHAGIATQVVVERQIAPKTRHDLGRTEFLRKVWEWKAQSGGMISQQFHSLGVSPDWSRDRFTMDEGLSAAVRKVFVQLHSEGLIYKDKRLVNWDCQLQSAISDLEVNQEEVDGHLWYIRYPLKDRPGQHLIVATTRPETMLGDSGIAVHTEDERYTDLVGQHAVLPLVGRDLLIVADDYSDPEKGSGAVKMTPAHDFNDFEVGRRHDLAMINILDVHGRLNDEVPAAYRGMDRFEVRKKIVADLEAAGLIEKIEPIRHAVPVSDRSGTVVEPFLSDQWYVDAKTLAKEAIKAVEDGRTRFVPKQYENVYFEWMRNIQPWCISRQLWWGHQIPAWYGPDGEVFVASDQEGAEKLAEAHYGKVVELTQDEDVLDTWFSSGLWPFSTLGWPEETPELRRYYPTSVLVTGFDIIFFWVARMMMLGLKFMGEVPFKDIYIHGLVRDEHGQKMSKSKGNVIDPLDLIEKYGADALRFTILASTGQGRDIKFGEARVQGYRNFATKLWNAARFTEMNGCALDPDFDPASSTNTVNRWIVSKLGQTAQKTRDAFENYRFNEAANTLYQFTWNEFCDWYLELAKPMLQGDDEAAKAETQKTTAWVLARILHLLHPATPFVTEELWQRRFGSPGGSLIEASWPVLGNELMDEAAEAEIDWLVRSISAIRTARSEAGVPAGTMIAFSVHGADALTLKRVGLHQTALMRLARLTAIKEDEGETPKKSLQVVVDEATFSSPLADVIDLDQERQRIDKELAKTVADLGKIEKKLTNPQFLDRAPANVVEEQRSRQTELEQNKEKLEAALARIAD